MILPSKHVEESTMSTTTFTARTPVVDTVPAGVLWLAHVAARVLRVANRLITPAERPASQRDRAAVLRLARSYERVQPNLAAELRAIALRDKG
jgi:hypothetical protein